MKLRTVAAAALVAGFLGAPAGAQIIATSIPKAPGGKTGGGQWAIHLMASPFAKWKISTFQEDTGFFLATNGNPKSDFLAAGEVAFKAGDAVSIGLGGWGNKVGQNEFEYIAFLADPTGNFVLAGPLTLDLTYTEVHGNIFFKNVGVQAGIVHSSSTVQRITATTGRLGNINVPTSLLNSIVNPILAREVNGVQDKANDLDGYLVFKLGSSSDSRSRWGFSLGSGFYRYDIGKKTVFSGFATATIEIYKGLGVDASAWYVGKTKRTELQTALSQAGVDLDQNLSRVMVGVSINFSK